MPINHLVLSGGGSTMGFMTFGVLQCACNQGMLDMEEVKSVYCTSAGSTIGPLFCLGLDLSELEEWLINKPWQNVFTIDPESILDGYESGGFLGRDTVDELYDNLLLSRDMPKEITLKGLFERNGIDLHLFCTALSKCGCQPCDMSHTTHPNLSLKEAIYRSSTIPVVFRPLTEEGTVYFDGGIWHNFPFSPWREAHPDADLDTVLAVKYSAATDTTADNSPPDLRMPILLLSLLRNLLVCINKRHQDEDKIKFICVLNQNVIKQEDFFLVLSDRNLRRSLVCNEAPLVAQTLIDLFKSHQTPPPPALT